MNDSKYRKIEKNQQGLHDKFLHLVTTELDWYEREALALLGKKRLPALQDNQIIQQMLAKSPNDENKKLSDPAYYTANVVAYLKVCKDILQPNFIKQFDVSSGGVLDDLIIYNYHRLFRALLFDSLVLLNEYAYRIKERVEPPYGCGKNLSQHHMTMYQSLKQSIFGQASFHSFTEIQPDLAVSIIRQIVELRVRRAFGVLGWYQPQTQSVEPLPISKLFEEIKKHESDIDLSVPLECLMRIYGWSNIFLHTGIKDYIWKPIVVKQYLKEFCLGKQGQYNVNGGVVVTKSVLAAIVRSLEQAHPAGAQIIIINPEAVVKDA
ncbi:hypothetical protein [Nitrosomonas communis]|uniref:Uncharacterized protein n=1 Tax=Nitrosomonas communis TaxID=44574 RepID=A0A1H2SRN2_9PROT|nr:hypothetical protein [Nitrosomonas communis]SDW33704.1 hypothetical protein SAMN05421882_10088 [Nitrosomonas communis]